MEHRPIHPSHTDLFRQDHYTVTEFAALVDIQPHVIEHAAFAGDLQAVIVDHHVISISRESAIAWLTTRLQEGDVEG